MTEIVSVRFKDAGKVYYFDPNGLKVRIGDNVIVETARGVECATVAAANRFVEDDSLVSPLKPILRIATAEDKATLEKNKQKEREAYEICVKKIEDHGLDMSLSEVEYAFDGSKIIFFFTADGRVDFRELVKDLASTFHTRIELRQIGVRDEAKMLGGLGISGTCGRLMCCLQYEENSYEYLNKITPKRGSIVDCKEGRGVVVDVSLLAGKLKVALDSSVEGAAPVVVNREECVVVKEPGKRRSAAKSAE